MSRQGAKTPPGGRGVPLRPELSSIEAALDSVLDATALRRLSRLRATVGRGVSGRLGSTPVAGLTQASGIEVESHASYSPGDDLRHLDWNAYARLGELLTRLFRAEREVPVYLFVDFSRSMGVPVADGKLPFACGLAASIAFVATNNHDPARVVALASQRPPSRRFAHRDQLVELAAFLRQIELDGSASLVAGVEATLADVPAGGVAVVLSDFLSPPEELAQVRKALLARRMTTTFVRILGEGERDPGRALVSGRFVDCETGAERRVRLTPANLAAYRRALGRHLTELADGCRRDGVAFVVADTRTPLSEVLFRDLLATGALRILG